MEAGASSVATALHAWLVRCLSVAAAVHLPRTKHLVSRCTITQAKHEASTAPPWTRNALAYTSSPFLIGCSHEHTFMLCPAFLRHASHLLAAGGCAGRHRGAHGTMLLFAHACWRLHGRAPAHGICTIGRTSAFSALRVQGELELQFACSLKLGCCAELATVPTSRHTVVAAATCCICVMLLATLKLHSLQHCTSDLLQLTELCSSMAAMLPTANSAAPTS